MQALKQVLTIKVNGDLTSDRLPPAEVSAGPSDERWIQGSMASQIVRSFQVRPDRDLPVPRGRRSRRTGVSVRHHAGQAAEDRRADALRDRTCAGPAGADRRR